MAMAMKKTKSASLLLSLLLILLSLSFQDTVMGARLHYHGPPFYRTRYTPPSPSCGSGIKINEVHDAPKRLCRHPKRKRPSTPNP
ncbi:uncharacterized protein LOC111832161 [Capsella rubella]|uniref:uncharacterized protein LOC111832161 n=1 Tax=Capsella rubella TaxID=81985 RepID=UPI000CD4B524|nr:uncharacterized protein LOC111832161 [Capsella rubella]